MPTSPEDARWLDAAARLAQRGIPLSRPNPAVGAILVNDGTVVGRGWTQPGGRPHAEAVALAQAGNAASGGTLYVTLEPCAHVSHRGPACTDLILASGLKRIVVGSLDPDKRTCGNGLRRMRAANLTVEDAVSSSCVRTNRAHTLRILSGRPHVTLKLALSQDGRLTPGPGKGQWLTGEIARAHVHAMRAKMDAILVGRGTFEADMPRLDVRLPGLEHLSPERWLLTRGNAPDGWRAIAAPEAISAMGDAQFLMVEGGAETARAFLAADLVDRVLLYRAPIAVSGDGPALPDLVTSTLTPQMRWAWQRAESRTLGNDTLDVYERL